MRHFVAIVNVWECITSMMVLTRIERRMCVCACMSVCVRVCACVSTYMTYWSWNVHDATFTGRTEGNPVNKHTLLLIDRAHAHSYTFTMTLYRRSLHWPASPRGPVNTTYAWSWMETVWLLVSYWSNSVPTVTNQQLKPPAVCLLLCVCNDCGGLWLLSGLDAGVGWVWMRCRGFSFTGAMRCRISRRWT